MALFRVACSAENDCIQFLSCDFRAIGSWYWDVFTARPQVFIAYIHFRCFFKLYIVLVLEA